jgi:hypothetical protein
MQQFLQNIINAFTREPITASIYALLWILGIFVIWTLIVRIVRFFYAVKKSKDLVYMKILLPRKETHKDREEQTEKDFKEIIGVMEQLFSGIYELKELNLGNIIRTWLWNLDTVSFELVYEKKQVYFYVVTYDWYANLLEKQITSYYVDAEIEYTEPFRLKQDEKKHTRSFFLYQKRSFYYPIRTYKNLDNDPLNDLTNVFSKLKDEDRAVIQMVINARGTRWNRRAKKIADRAFKGEKSHGVYEIPVIGFILKIIGSIFGVLVKGESPTNAPGASSGDRYVRMLQTDEEIWKKVGEKAHQAGFDTTIRVIAQSDEANDAQNIISNIVLAFNVFMHGGMNWFQSRRIVPVNKINNAWMFYGFNRRLVSLGEKVSIMVPEELASVYHFPNARYNQNPTIAWLQYRILPAPIDLPKEGTLLGYNVYRGEKHEVRILKDDRTRHQYIIGKSGSGKSVLLNYMARQDIINGEGLCVVDPHGDLIEDCLLYVPKERARDVIIFNPSDQTRPMGLNILEADTPEQMDMASSQATEIFIKIFGDEIFGPRIQHYFRNACLTLMEDKDEGATLIDVPRMFVDNEFMKYKVSKVKNPIVRSFWEHEYANTGERERQEMIPYFSAKFGPFITNMIMRNTIGQPKSAFDFREVMDNKKILLINLSKGKMGDLNTQLLGLIVVARIQMAAMARADMPKEDRKDFYLYVDEFQNFATDSFASILSEARKYKLGLIMAHQYIGQLTVSRFGTTSTAIRDAIFGNVGTMLSFKIGAEDAEYMAKEYAPVVSESDVIGIANYKAYIKLNIKNTTSRPFTLETIYDTTGASEKSAEILKEYSRMKYGRKKIFVDQEIESRIGLT